MYIQMHSIYPRRTLSLVSTGMPEISKNAVNMAFP